MRASQRQAYAIGDETLRFTAPSSCQVLNIHPGKPRNPQEPGLDEFQHTYLGV